MPWVVKTTILTDAEAEIERRLSCGQSIREIAKTASVTRDTIKSHAKRIRKKRAAAQKIIRGLPTQ